MRSDLEKIHEAGSKVADIVSDLLSFSKNQTQTKKCQESINEAVESSVKLIRGLYEKEGISLDEELTDNLPQISGNFRQIQEIILNMMSNAKDAILESGKGSSIKIKTGQSNGNVILEVSDDGPGIPREFQDKIFEPFFTTKPPGKGIGLGLFVTYNIIKEHNGKISLRNQEKGATFKIEFPVTCSSTL